MPVILISLWEAMFLAVIEPILPVMPIINTFLLSFGKLKTSFAVRVPIETGVFERPVRVLISFAGLLWPF